MQPQGPRPLPRPPARTHYAGPMPLQNRLIGADAGSLRCSRSCVQIGSLCGPRVVMTSLVMDWPGGRAGHGSHRRWRDAPGIAYDVPLPKPRSGAGAGIRARRAAPARAGRRLRRLRRRPHGAEERAHHLVVLPAARPGFVVHGDTHNWMICTHAPGDSRLIQGARNRRSASPSRGGRIHFTTLGDGCYGGQQGPGSEMDVDGR